MKSLDVHANRGEKTAKLPQTNTSKCAQTAYYEYMNTKESRPHNTPDGVVWNRSEIVHHTSGFDYTGNINCDKQGTPVPAEPIMVALRC